MPDTVAVVVPARDAEAHLAAALESVLAQAGPELDVVVVDDASRDGTAGIAAAFASRGVRLVRLPDPGGERPVRIGSARSAGVEATRGTWVTFLDADDVWPPGRLRTALAAFAADPELELCFGHAAVFRDDPSAPDEVVPGWLAGTLMMRRSTWERVGPMRDFAAGELADWLLRARELGLKEAMLGDVLLRRRVHGANHTGSAANLQGYTRVLKAALDRRRGLQA